MKLSKSQITALKKMRNARGGAFFIPFRTGESLRRKGLAERYTEHILKAEYAQRDGTTLQYRATARKPHLKHEWYLTLDGEAALGAI